MNHEQSFCTLCTVGCMHITYQYTVYQPLAHSATILFYMSLINQKKKNPWIMMVRCKRCVFSTLIGLKWNGMAFVHFIVVKTNQISKLTNWRTGEQPTANSWHVVYTFNIYDVIKLDKFHTEANKWFQYLSFVFLQKLILSKTVIDIN